MKTSQTVFAKMEQENWEEGTAFLRVKGHELIF
jgi:hypothetical protein